MIIFHYNKEACNLLGIVKWKSETLKFYTQRFNKEIIEISDCHDLAGIQLYQKGLLNESLCDQFLDYEDP